MMVAPAGKIFPDGSISTWLVALYRDRKKWKVTEITGELGYPSPFNNCSFSMNPDGKGIVVYSKERIDSSDCTIYGKWVSLPSIN